MKNTVAHAHAALLLEDGKVFFGKSIGADKTGLGEICFNTGMTGYQEVLTDLSYAGQIVTFTFPHIGNTGTNDEDIEAKTPAVQGAVIRESITSPSNFRHTQHFDAWLKERGIPGISGVDTRALTRHIRLNGAKNAAIVRVKDKNDKAVMDKALAELKKLPTMKGRELAKEVTTPKHYAWEETVWRLAPAQRTPHKPDYNVVAIDYGEKLNILRSLAERGCKVTVVSSHTPAKDILALKPDGIFLSNGPGDPSATAQYAAPILQELIDSGLPVFGICLGHQLLGHTLGGKTEKLHQGHRGSNHPVKNLETGKVEITSQNHGFAVMADSLPADVEVTHVSLFDGTVEGLKHKTKKVFSVQYHPESSPGPHDSQYLFDKFIGMMKANA